MLCPVCCPDDVHQLPTVPDSCWPFEFYYDQPNIPALQVRAKWGMNKAQSPFRINSLPGAGVFHGQPGFSRLKRVAFLQQLKGNVVG